MSAVLELVLDGGARLEPGEEIHGNLIFRLLKPRAIRSITVSVVGETILRRTKKGSEQDEVRTEKHRHLDIPIPLLSFPDKSESESFEIGEHRFPFTFRLPVDIPGNMVCTSYYDEFKTGKPKYEVHYWIEADCRCVKRNQDSCGLWNSESANRITSPAFPFTVSESLNLDMFPASYSRAYYQQRRFFSPGDAILVSVRFYNKTEREYQGLLLDLIKSEDYNVRDNGRDHKKHKLHVISHKFIDRSIQANANTFLVGSVLVPDIVTPVTCNGYKRRIKIGYFLEVRMAYGKQLDRIPLLILSRSAAQSVSEQTGNVWRDIVKALSLSSSSTEDTPQSPASTSSNVDAFEDASSNVDTEEDDPNITLMV